MIADSMVSVFGSLQRLSTATRAPYIVTVNRVSELTGHRRDRLTQDERPERLAPADHFDRRR